MADGLERKEGASPLEHILGAADATRRECTLEGIASAGGLGGRDTHRRGERNGDNNAGGSRSRHRPAI
jgi:hypothetical protein